MVLVSTGSAGNTGCLRTLVGLSKLEFSPDTFNSSNLLCISSRVLCAKLVPCCNCVAFIGTSCCCISFSLSKAFSDFSLWYIELSSMSTWASWLKFELLFFWLELRDTLYSKVGSAIRSAFERLIIEMEEPGDEEACLTRTILRRPGFLAKLFVVFKGDCSCANDEDSSCDNCFILLRLGSWRLELVGFT
ncbi:hypothetical protein BpHYR1_023506 [Brachionus plicatilis]|uniref:Uncharacterized protein n=1 Tax=Brachionus plicatilis TaxID=10195 RepID=A0A3M7P5C7_BRAPC|nr:hypothetical protein BpHYR1_023506 [Brachionus plicatilis]